MGRISILEKVKDGSIDLPSHIRSKSLTSDNNMINFCLILYSLLNCRKVTSISVEYFVHVTRFDYFSAARYFSLV